MTQAFEIPADEVACSTVRVRISAMRAATLAFFISRWPVTWAHAGVYPTVFAASVALVPCATRVAKCSHFGFLRIPLIPSPFGGLHPRLLRHRCHSRLVDAFPCMRSTPTFDRAPFRMVGTSEVRTSFQGFGRKHRRIEPLLVSA